jgi:hypothetical protein
MNGYSHFSDETPGWYTIFADNTMYVIYLEEDNTWTIDEYRFTEQWIDVSNHQIPPKGLHDDNDE